MSKSKYISSLSKLNIYFPFDINTLTEREYNVPLFFLLLMILILLSFFSIFLIISKVLSIQNH